MAEVKSNLQRLAGLGTRGQVAALTARVDELEQALHETRRQHQRLAELTDIVQELLVPIEARDEAKVAELISRYTEQLG